jgi:hypothetical protein
LPAGPVLLPSAGFFNRKDLAMKELAVLILILLLMGLVGEQDFQDQQAAAEVNDEIRAAALEQRDVVLK